MPIVAGRLLLEPLSPDGRIARVELTFIYRSKLLGDITILGGKVTDYNSTPRFAWRLFPPWEFPLAGVVHDQLYESGRCDERAIERWEADDVHLEVMRELDAPEWKAVGSRVFLEIGGWKPWNRYRRQPQQARV